DGIRDRNVTGVQTCALPILKTFCGRLTEASKSRRSASQRRNSASRSLATMLSGTITAMNPPDLASLTKRSVKNTSMAVLARRQRSEEHTSELQSRFDLVCRL